ncbi:MAG: Ig-like domain-containing protein [Corynebacterium sp.]|nr:Ig-like domain-containing protein [Corynebacterium sp.]
MKKPTLRILAPVAAVLAAISLAACSSSGNAIPGVTITEKPAPANPVASIQDGASNVNPNTAVSVRPMEGNLTDVTMTNEDGKVVDATLAADGSTWQTNEELGYGRTYTIVAHNSAGGAMTSTFTTINPAAQASVALSPLADSTVGIGQTIHFRFSQAIPDREAAQKSIEITTNPPVEGAFYWVSNQEIRWRPAQYWTPGTQVTVKVHNYGTDLGDGVYGGDDNETNFTIGDAVISTVDDSNKIITVTKNGEVVKTMPTSMGNAQNPTPNGVYTVGDRYDSIVMDSSTFGLAVDAPGGYRSNVQYATQLSYSGIFVHSAPWSVWAQGNTDTSHGCLNVSPENAKWFLDFSKRGDLVVVSGTQGGTLSGTDGLGDWNIPWETWKAGNAT